jgi:hypothetical protein
MATIISANETLVKVRLGDQSVTDVPRREVNFQPVVGDEVDVYNQKGKLFLVLRTDKSSDRSSQDEKGNLRDHYWGRVLINMIWYSVGFIMIVLILKSCT